MPAAAVAGAGLLISAYSASTAASAQRRAQDLQQSAIQSDQAFRQRQYDDYKRMYGPLEQELLQKANSEQPLNLGPNWSRIQANFDQAGRNNEASLARKGMLGSGIDTHNNLESARAFTLSDAFSKGIQSRDALRLQLLNAGKNMPQQAGFVAQGNQNMANFYGNQANQYASAAGAAGQGIASGLGALGYALGNTAPAPTVNASIVAPTDTLSPIPTPRDLSGLADLVPGIPAYPSVNGLGNAFLPTSAGFNPSTLGSSPITGPADR